MIRLSKSCVGEREQRAVERVMRRAFFGMGEEVSAFERELAEFIGTPEVVCVNTGTSALHAALAALDITEGDEVIVPTLTYVASLQAISATGATAVLCDIDETTMTLDVEDARARINQRTKAIVFVYYASCPGTLDASYALAKEYKLRVVEDAAHAFGCKHRQRLVGASGDVTCFSFDGIKNITSGEGGAVVSRDDTLLQRVRSSRLLGVQADQDVTRQGWRFHMSDLFAAIGREQLKRLPAELGPRRVALAKRYQQELSGLPVKALYMPLDEIIPHIYPVRVSAQKRDFIRETLQAAGIATGLHYKPNHLLSYYQTSYSLPVAERVYRELLTLPLHPEITDEEQTLIIETLREHL